MEIFRIKQTDMMGFVMSENFFVNQDDALKRFDEMIEEYRQNDNLASDDDAAEQCINNEAISICENKNHSTKRAMICLWDKCSYEDNDWEVVAEHLNLEKIEVKD